MKNYTWKLENNIFKLAECNSTTIFDDGQEKKLINTGMHYDHAFIVYANEIPVGIVCVSELKNEQRLHIDWIEIMTVFRHKGILKSIFRGLSELFNVEYIDLEAGDMNYIKFLAIGCINRKVESRIETHKLTWKYQD